MADSLRGVEIDSTGRPINSVLIRVYLAGTGTLASLFSDKALTTPIVNDGLTSPLSEADGSYGPYYVASGRYDIKPARTGYVFDNTDSADITVFDPAQIGAAALIASGAVGGVGAVTVQGAIGELEAEKMTYADVAENAVLVGLLGSDPGASLTMVTPGGIFSYAGLRVIKPVGDADLTHTYTASKDTYVDISNAGVVTYIAVATGAAAPAITASSLRLEKVVTDGTEITSVVDLRRITIGPSCSAYLSANQALAAGALTQIVFDTTKEDSYLQFNTATYRFVPLREGTYSIVLRVNFLNTGHSIQKMQLAIKKNGVIVGENTFTSTATVTSETTQTVSCLVRMNGSSDYLEGFALSNGNTADLVNIVSGETQTKIYAARIA
jgi:hypothetical protein